MRTGVWQSAVPDSLSSVILSVEIFARLGANNSGAAEASDFLKCEAVCFGEWVWSAGSGNM